jgi:hypothetical protein
MQVYAQPLREYRERVVTKALLSRHQSRTSYFDLKNSVQARPLPGLKDRGAPT